MQRKTLPFTQKLALSCYQYNIQMLHAVAPNYAAKKTLQLFTKPLSPKRNYLQPIMESAANLSLNFEGIEVQGYQWKPANPNGQKMLIAHGFGGRIAAYGPNIELALSLGYEVIGFDAPAHGTTKGKYLNVMVYSQLLTQIVQEFGAFQVFLAHSMGGLSISLTISTLQLPSTSKLILVAPATETTTAANIFFNFMEFNDSIRKSFEEYVFDTSGQPLDWYSISRVAPQFACKVLWISEATDELTPLKDVEPVMAMQLPNFQFYITKGYSHHGLYKKEEVIGVMKDFICQ